jgi:uncharacterized SAM-binding protein YcdF (DUF218 family)
MGVPESDVLIEPESTSTLDEPRHCKSVMRQTTAGGALLVTSAMHMPRALATFQSAGLSVIPAPTEPIIRPPVLGAAVSRWWP